MRGEQHQGHVRVRVYRLTSSAESDAFDIAQLECRAVSNAKAWYFVGKLGAPRTPVFPTSATVPIVQYPKPNTLIKKMSMDVTRMYDKAHLCQACLANHDI